MKVGRFATYATGLFGAGTMTKQIYDIGSRDVTAYTEISPIDNSAMAGDLENILLGACLVTGAFFANRYLNDQERLERGE